MQNIRWNKRYLSGDSRLDNRNQALVALLADIRLELGSKEHCAEMEELYARLATLTKQKLAQPGQDRREDGAAEDAIRALLKDDFPLATRSTPACRECGLCDLMADRVAGWLSVISED